VPSILIIIANSSLDAFVITLNHCVYGHHWAEVQFYLVTRLHAGLLIGSHHCDST